MRKQLKLLLLAVMLLCMLGLTMLVAAAAEEPVVDVDVFEVVTVDGETETHVAYYQTFADAMAAVKSGAGNKINLKQDVTLSAGIQIDADVVLDGEGHTITFDATVAGANALTVDEANPNVIADGIAYGVKIGTATVTMQDLTLVATDMHFYTAVIGFVGTDAALTLDGTTVTGGGISVYWASRASLTVKSGSYLGGTSQRVLYSEVNADAASINKDNPIRLIIEGGELNNLSNGAFEEWTNETNTYDLVRFDQFIYVRITGGTFKSHGAAVYGIDGSDVVVGTEGGDNAAILMDVKQCVVPNGPSKVTVYSGTFRATGNLFGARGNGTVMTIAGGDWVGNSAYVEKGATLNVLVDLTFTSDVNNNGIEVRAGANLVIDTDITLTSGRYAMIIRAGATVEISKGAYTGSFYTQGTLNIKGGTFTNPAGSNSPYLIDVLESGTATIDGGTFTAPNASGADWVLYSRGDNSVLTVNDGTFYGIVKMGNAGVTGKHSTIIINGGTFSTHKDSAQTYLLMANAGNARMIINGGTFTYDNPNATTSSCVLYVSAATNNIVTVTGGTFEMHSLTAAYLIDKRNGVLNIDWTRDQNGDPVVSGGKKVGPTFNVSGAVALLVNREATQVMTTISGGYFNQLATYTGDGTTASAAHGFYLYKPNASSASDLGFVVNDGVFNAYSSAEKYFIYGSFTKKTNITVNGGEFISTGYSRLLQATVYGTLQLNGGAFIANGKMQMSAITLKNGGVMNITGGEYITQTAGLQGFSIYGEAGGVANISGAFFGHLRKSVVEPHIANNTSIGVDTSAGNILFLNTASTVNITSGTFINNTGNQAVRINQSKGSLNIYGGDFYGHRNFSVSGNSGVCDMNIYGGTFNHAPGQSNCKMFDFFDHGNDAHTSTINVYNATLNAPTSTAAGYGLFFLAGYVNLTLGGTYTDLKGNQVEGVVTYDGRKGDTSFIYAGSATVDKTTYAYYGTVTVNNIDVIGTKSNYKYIINVTEGNIVFNGGRIQCASNCVPIGITGSANATFNDMLVLPDICGDVDPNAAAVSKKVNATGYTQGIILNTTGTVVINDGVYTNGDGNHAFSVTGTKVTVNGGTFFGFRDFNMYAGAEVTIYGGNFYAPAGYANSKMLELRDATSKLTIYGGTFDTTYTAAGTIASNGGIIVYTGPGEATVYGGTFIANGTAGSALVRFDTAGKLTIDSTTVGEKVYAGPTMTKSGEGTLFLMNNAEATATVNCGDYTIMSGTDFANAMTGLTIAEGANVTVTVGAGAALPTEDLDGYEGQYANAIWTVKSWDRFEIASAVTLTSLADYYAACQAYIEDYMVNIIGYMDIIPGENCTVEITEWVPLVVVEGGDLTINFAEKLVLETTLVTVEGGKVTVLDGEYVGADFGNTLNGLFNVLGGELTLKNGSYTMTDGGSIVYFVSNANADVTIEGGTYLLDNAGANYHQGSVVRVGAWNDPVYGTLTIKGGDFTAARAVTIYAVDLDGDGNAVDGFTANVLGGTFTSNALENVNADNKYLFQIARDGKHTINVSNATVTGTAWGLFFMANASGNHATFNLDKLNVSGGLSWIYTNKPNTVFNVSNSTFTDITGEMKGVSNVLISLENANTTATFTNVTFTMTSDNGKLALLSPWTADNSATVTLDNVKATAPRFLYPNSKGVVNVVDLFLIQTGSMETVLSTAIEANLSITRAVIIANSTYAVPGVAFGGVQVMKGGVAYGAYIKVPATDANYTTTQEAGAAIDVTSEFIATNPEKGGIRFLSTISQEVAETLLSDYEGATFSFGTLIAPADYVVAAGAFTMEALDKLQVSGVKYVDIPAVDTFDDTNGDGIPESFSGALIKLKSYTRAYAGISYIKITHFGETTYLYGEFDSVTNARSAKQVADAMIADGNSAYYTEYSAEQKAVVDAYAGKVSE